MTVERIRDLEAQLWRLQKRYNRLVAQLDPRRAYIQYGGEVPCSAEEFSQWAQAVGAKVECDRLTVHLTDSTVLPHNNPRR